MKKKLMVLGMAAVFSIGLGACGNADESSGEPSTKSSATETKKQETQKVNYLGKEYTIPSEVKTIVTASLESMEDAAALGVKPAGAITVGGEIPEYLAKDLEGAASIGEKMQPNYETILGLKPDVIMWTSKSDGTVTEKMEKMAPTFPYSHISTNWEDNLRLMAKLSGKEDKAESIISQYKKDAAQAKAKIADKLKDKKVLVVRVRNGSLFLYPQDVYFNPVLYTDLGIAVPKEIEPVKAQEMIALEKFAEMDPDYIFLQFSESENAQKPKALEELENNSIWKSIKAVKNDKVFVNSVDPLAQGGTAWSKTAFLQAATENLAK